MTTFPYQREYPPADVIEAAEDVIGNYDAVIAGASANVSVSISVHTELAEPDALCVARMIGEQFLGYPPMLKPWVRDGTHAVHLLDKDGTQIANFVIFYKG